MTWVTRSVRFLLVTGGIIALTSLGIDATQYLSGAPSALGILADRATEGNCPTGMVFVEHGTEDFCIDRFEMSPGLGCSHESPRTSLHTSENLDERGCTPASEEDQTPWTHVTYRQAEQLCAQAGKRLPTQLEWYHAALGTKTSVCTTDSQSLVRTGSAEDCVSGVGVYDMVGNVWEWVSGDVVDGMYDNRSLPETGYVSNTDAAGVALTTSIDPQHTFGDDYFWSNRDGRFVMMRGGFYGSGEDAGIYSVHADVQGDFSSGAIGFRCVAET